MATTNTIQDIIDARNIALIRGDIDAVNALNKTLNAMIPGGGKTSDPTVGGTPVGQTETFSTVNNPQTQQSSKTSTILDTKDNIIKSTIGAESFVEIPNTQFNPGAQFNPGGFTSERVFTDGQNSDCIYRYSLGCPVFSRYISDAGCRVLLPIYRTCYLYILNVNSTLMPKSEIVGHIEITAYADFLNQTQTNYVNVNGVTGTRYIQETHLSSNGLKSAIEDLASIKSATNWVQSSDGIFRNTGTPLSIETIVNNLESIIVNTGTITFRPKGSLQDWINYLIKNCDLSKQPTYCVSSETFVPFKTENVTTPIVGKYCDTSSNKIAIPNTRRFLRTETRPSTTDIPSEQYVAIPNKPCMLGLARQVQTIQIYSEDYGHPCYVNSDFSGNILDYVSTETRETSVFGEIHTVYVSERIDPNCAFTEYDREYEEDDPANPCLGIIKKDVIRKYVDNRQEIFAKGVFVRYYRKMDADCSPETIKVYYPFDLGKDIISAKVKVKTTGLFNLSQSIDCYTTSSTQTANSRKYYYEVGDCDSCDDTSYFAVAYGNRKGSGSLYVEGDVYDTPTKAIHSQYRLLALDPSETQFQFYTNGVVTASNDVYVINFSRTGLSDRLDPGNFEIDLAELNGGSYANNLFTGSNVQISGSNKIIKLIDNSLDNSDLSSCIHDPYVSYDIVSGSLTNGIYTSATTHTYGIVYPNLGIIVLDPYKLNSELSFNTVTGSNIAGDNAAKLFKSISGSGALGSNLKARNVKYKTTNHYFVRVSSPLANHSNNPTYVSGSDGYLFHSCFESNPQTYITTVGLYNDFNELLAVAKLSQPINKSFDNDVLLKIRLNW